MKRHGINKYLRQLQLLCRDPSDLAVIEPKDRPLVLQSSRRINRRILHQRQHLLFRQRVHHRQRQILEYPARKRLFPQ